MARLSDKQAAFVAEYLVDKNATDAAKRAGYSERTAYSQGQRLLKNVEIQKAISVALEEQQKRTELNADYVLTGLKAIAERCMEAVPVLDSEGCETGQWRFNAAGANKALELIGKHLGMFKERVEHSGDPDNPICHEHGVSPAIEAIFTRMAKSDQG